MDLVERAKAGDELAFARLCRDHAGLIAHHAQRYFAPGLTREDVFQEARFGFWKAVQSFRPDRHSGFGHFASLCVARQCVTAVKTAQRDKHRPLNESKSISQHSSDHEDMEVQWDLPDVAADPVLRLIARERYQEALDVVRLSLSDMEARCFWHVVADGDSYDATAMALGITEKNVDNAVQRAKRKLAHALEPPQTDTCDICAKPTHAVRCEACAEEIEFARQFVA